MKSEVDNIYRSSPSQGKEPMLTLDYFLERLYTRQPWREYAACKGDSIVNYFGDESRGGGKPISVCWTCAVNVECLLDNLGEPYGVWGGTVGKDRRAIKARKEEGSPAPDISHGTSQGYREHFKYGEVPPCLACVEAFDEEEEARRVA